MEKRYQVFVSSTYEDLRQERQAVIQSLLEFDCIPVGMEFFPAADDSAWEIIKRVIEESDYYVVIVAGRYGSLTPEGISYTQKEYAYAIERGVPVMAFLHDDPGKIPAEKTEASDECRKKLSEFRGICQKDKLCKTWKTADELAGAVIKSLNQLKKTRERTGWVRADQVLDESAAKTILKLKTRIEELMAESESLRLTPPSGTDDLAQGDDVLKIVYEAHFGFQHYQMWIRRTWNEIFDMIGPSMINEATERQVKDLLNKLVKQSDGEEWRLELERLIDSDLRSFSRAEVDVDSFHTIMIQLRSLGLIMQSTRPRSIKDTITYWKLTPYGDNLLTKRRAIRRQKSKSKVKSVKV